MLLFKVKSGVKIKFGSKASYQHKIGLLRIGLVMSTIILVMSCNVRIYYHLLLLSVFVIISFPEIHMYQ